MQRITVSSLAMWVILATGATCQEWGDHRPVLSPVDSILAFMSNRSDTWSVYLMDLRGHAPHRVSDDPAGEWYPDWSPDGRFLVYHRRPEGARNPQLFVFDVASRVERQITHDPSAENHYARWSPDGSYLVFPSTRDGESDLYRINIDGSGERPIVTLPLGQGDPALSPDGSLLAFTSEVASGGTEIFVAPLSDFEQRRQLTNYGAVSYGIDWSPDGKRIAYTTDGDGDHEIHVIDLSTGVDRRLTSNDVTDHLPRWSRDGQFIVFSRELGEAERIYMMRVDGSDVRTIDTGKRR